MAFALTTGIIKAGNFTPGNIVVTKVGDGTTVYANGMVNVPVQVVEYSSTLADQASAVQSIPMNYTSGSPMLTLAYDLEGYTCAICGTVTPKC